ncbi:CBS domain-containing protein [Beijerinckia sp. L45]|uniref:CBS domain-containing protein n=1 Tax=Beijerinckia sp. L45 TaxID=1641855 RepID=UPI001FEEF634|nr:CBS domain-containing protein [Beijerinckia sp. L45]
MPYRYEELEAIRSDLIEGRAPPSLPIRTFMHWFGAQRRTAQNVETIERALADYGIRTVPNYLNIWVDTPITFELAPAPGAADGDHDDKAPSADATGAGDAPTETKSSDDPSFRISKIASANRPPVSVKPNASLLEAVTIMIVRNYSQLPVMTTDREVKGVISWTSIGVRLAADARGSDVQAYMNEAHEIPASASIFAALKVIFDHDYVLVRAPDRKIVGIVTSNDIGQQFEESSTPFLLLGEVENHLRALVRGRLDLQDIERACASQYLPEKFTGAVAELTFGNFVRILDHEENWTKLALKLDRAAFCKELAAINAIRNDVMHFDPDPISEDDLAKLRNVARMFSTLRGIGAF